MSTTDTHAESNATAEKVAILVTGLYDDAATVEAAIESSYESTDGRIFKLHPENMTDDNWDDAVKLVLSVSKVITV